MAHGCATRKNHTLERQENFVINYFNLVQLKEIKEIPFPAVTICYDINDWKWPGIVSSLAEFGNNDAIANAVLDRHIYLSPRIPQMRLAFMRSKEFKSFDQNFDILFIDTIIPEELQRIAKLVHFIAFSEQSKASTSYYTYQILELKIFRYVWKRQLFHTLNQTDLLRIGKLMEDDLCNMVGPGGNINITESCVIWNDGDCNIVNKNSTINSWCEDCFTKDCLHKTLDFKEKVLVPMLLIHRYINKQNMLDYLLGSGRIIFEGNTDSLYDLDQSILSYNVKTIQSWYYMNGEKKEIADDLINNVAERQNNQSGSVTDLLDSNILQKLSNLFSKPSIHGNSQKDYVIMPLCSFGSDQMKPCSLFAASKFDFAKQRCFTFNGNYTNYRKSSGIALSKGLKMYLRFRTPRDFWAKLSTNNFKLILHQPGAAVDLHYETDSYVKLEPGYYYVIRAEATAVDVTQSFKGLDVKKRKCQLHPKNGLLYHQNNCYFDQMLAKTSEICGCIPWYLHYIDPVRKICVGEEFGCFERIIGNTSEQAETKRICLKACKFIKYSSSVSVKTNFLREEYDHDEIKADPLESYLETPNKSPNKYQSVVHVNFKDPYITEITQDAKVTFADMVGSIGGTFGVFLGLSFVSLMDELGDWIKWGTRKFREFTH